MGLAGKSVSERYLNVDNVLDFDDDEVKVSVAASEIETLQNTDQNSKFNLEENTKLTESLEDTIGRVISKSLVSKC